MVPSDIAPREFAKRSRARDLLILAAFTLLLHLPFLWQPVQGDEPTYLDVAREVFRQPFTPLNFSYVFQGRTVEAAGHPHPPLNAYLLTIPWMLSGGFSLVIFHVFYLLFALGISFAGYWLAGWFTSRPLWAALLLGASPLVQVNTNTVAGPEGPALAFLLAGAAAFFWRRLWMAAIALSLAALTALQALALPPILMLEYVIRRERPPRAVWIAMASPYFALGAWEAMQWLLTGRLPGALLLGNVQDPALSRLSLKAASAFLLLQHLGVLVTLAPWARRRWWSAVPGALAAILAHQYPWYERLLLALFVALGVNALLWIWESRRTQPLLAGWCLLYLAFASVAFFAGAARYLLPLAAPMVLLFILQFRNRPRWLALALAFNVLLGLNISFAAYEFSRVYAAIPPPPGRTFLVNGDWGFRYYLLQHGGRMLTSRSTPRPGEWIVKSDLALGGSYDSLAEETAAPLCTRDVWVRTPLRIIDGRAHSGFSSVMGGLLSFSFSNGPLDRITYSRTSSFLNVSRDWTPTQYSGRLVYVPTPGCPIRLPIDPPGARLRFALFAKGRGQADFVIRSPHGPPIFKKSISVDGELWEPHVVDLAGQRNVMVVIDYSQGLRAGWGELVLESRRGAAAGSDHHAGLRSYLNLADIRTKSQLIDGWYSLEDGAWRWMSGRAEAVLAAPQKCPVRFEMQVYFPPDHMRRAGGPVTVSVLINCRSLGQQTYSEPGGYRLEFAVPAQTIGDRTAQVSIRCSRAVAPSKTDLRELGAVVSALGFVVEN
jgi:hypothetical protein